MSDLKVGDLVCPKEYKVVKIDGNTRFIEPMRKFCGKLNKIKGEDLRGQFMTEEGYWWPRRALMKVTFKQISTK